MVRDHNEDAVHPVGTGAGSAAVVAVADGLGGHPGGDVASRLAIDAVAAGEGENAAALIAEARRRVVDHIMVETEERPELIAMATTLTLAVLGPSGSVQMGHVGDSLYVRHEGSLTQITDDHTIAMEMIRRGELTPEEAESDPSWHVINNWIGFESNDVETHDIIVGPCDSLLLCTDGLSNLVHDHDIEAILDSSAAVGARADQLIAAANASGGLDNITVVVTDVFERTPGSGQDSLHPADTV